jgi:mannosyltransferase
VDLTFRGAEPASREPSQEPLASAGPGVVAAPLTGPWTRVAVVVVLLLGVVARFATWSHLWLDEALTVNIARLPLDQIPGALRQDGAPPVYYLLLHGWMKVFGEGTFAVRALPGLFGVLTLPLTFLAAQRLAGRRVAWAATLLLASAPFAARYATEGRMYSLVMVLVLVGFLAVMRLLDGEGSRRLAATVLAVTTGVLLLTHYWAFYLGAVTAVALLVTARRATDHRRTGARWALGALAGGGVLFLPWVPSFLHQLRHTGTPWGRPGTLRSLFDTVTHFAGGYWDAGIPLGLLYFGLLVLALFGLSVDGRRILLDLHSHSPGNWLTAVAFGTLALAIVAGIVGGSAFAVRYAAVLYPLFILLVAVGAATIAGRRPFVAVLGVAVVLGFWGNVPNIIGDRTSAARVASKLNAAARPGDVVGYCPDQLGPPVTRELDVDGLVHLTYPLGRSPERVDWEDYAEINKAARPVDYAGMLLDRAGPDHDIWLVWAPGYRTVGSKCQNVIDLLDNARPDNDRLVKISTRYFERPGLVRFRAS